MASEVLRSLLDTFNEITKKPEKILSAPESLIDQVKQLLKKTYDFAKSEETEKFSNALPELIIENFDVEQIWQQLELQNNEVLPAYVNTVSRLLAFKDKLWFLNPEDVNNTKKDTEDLRSEKESENNSSNESEYEDTIGNFKEGLSNEESNNDEESNTNEESNNEEEISNYEDNDELFQDEDNNSIDKTNKTTKKKKSIVDDEFFKLHEMEEFLINEEKEKRKNKESDSEDDDNSVDLFENVSDNGSDHSENDELTLKEYNPRYKDFFGKSKSKIKKSSKNLDYSEEDNAENLENEKISNAEDEIPEQKSSLELREERLKKKIGHLEDNALREKSWQLKGEVTASKRPENSLLQEIVEFDMTTRSAPVITQETTFILEDIIKQRIKDKVFDSVERKIKPVETPMEYKKKLVLDQEKSKQSLAQIYEEEYIKQRDSLNTDNAEKQAEEPKEHKEIKTLMRNLFAKLDALSNFHFTPRIVAPELRVINNMPAINMEEVAPVAVSDATLLAPEEVKKKPRGDEIGQDEKTKTDKKRDRRKKKLKQHTHAKKKENKEKLIAKVKPELNNKYSKIKTEKLLDKVTKDRNVDKMDESIGSKATKSSTAFFTQLEDEVKNYIKTKTQPKIKNKRPGENPLQVTKKLKL